MVKIRNQDPLNIYSEGFRQFLRRLSKAKKLSPTEIQTCNCPQQICRGKFIRKFDWQHSCPWEMLRLGEVENTEELTKGKRFWENNFNSE